MNESLVVKNSMNFNAETTHIGASSITTLINWNEIKYNPIQIKPYKIKKS